MRKRTPRLLDKPSELMLSPMIDLIFLLLVFFILSTMYLVDLRTIPMQLPAAENSAQTAKNDFMVSVDKKGNLFLNEQPLSLHAVLKKAEAQVKQRPQFTVVIRGDGDADYKTVISVLDQLKGVGVKKFNLATEQGASP